MNGSFFHVDVDVNAILSYPIQNHVHVGDGGHDGENGFFIRFSNSNSVYNQDAYKPKWSEDIVYNKAGWVDINIEKKEGY